MDNVLILCTGNSCRSQMAHGFLKEMLASKAVVYSAGVETHGLNAEAVAAMKQAGIDIGHHSSNHVQEYLHIKFAHIISVCDHAREQCPVFPATAMRHHHNFTDPSKVTGSAEERALAFQQTVMEIKEWCQAFADAFYKTSH